MDCTPASLRARVPVPCEMVRLFFSFGVLGILLGALAPAVAAAPPPAAVPGNHAKLDLELRQRAGSPRGTSRVILRLNPGVPAGAVDAVVRKLRGTLGRRLASGGGQVANVPDTALAA